MSMRAMKMRAGVAAALMLLTGCRGGATTSDGGADGTVEGRQTRVPVRIATSAGSRTLNAELARTPAQQQRGLMYRTDLKPDDAMLFAPYPAEGGAPREASFWMKNTPTPLDIVFIRADGTIARIAENTVPFSETPVPSGEPVAAVLELRGGRAGELGIAEGDTVTWAGSGPASGA